MLHDRRSTTIKHVMIRGYIAGPVLSRIRISEKGIRLVLASSVPNPSSLCLYDLTFDLLIDRYIEIIDKVKELL